MGAEGRLTGQLAGGPERERGEPGGLCLMQQMLDSLPHMACLLREGRVKHANAAWKAFFATETGADWRAAAHPAEAASVASLQPGAPEVECRLRRAGGTGWEWFALAARPFGTTGEVLLTLWSVDRQRRKVAALVGMRDLQERMLTASPDCIKLLAPDGTLRHMNRAGCIALGVAPESGFGMAWLRLLPEEVWEIGAKALERARQGEVARFPGLSQLPGEALQHWDNVLTPVLDAAGQVTEIVCISRDVTAARQQEQELRLARQGLEVAAVMARLGRFELDATSGQLWADPRCAAMLGGFAPGTADLSGDFLAAVGDRDRARVAAALERALDPSGDGGFQCEFSSLPDAAGAVSTLLARGACLFEGGQPWRLIGTMQDVSEDRRTRHQLKEAGDRLATALQVEHTLSKEMHHRIKNLFAVVLGLISISGRDRLLNPEGQQVLGDLKQRILSMSRATELLFRSSEGQLLGDFDPKRVAEAVLDPYQGHVVQSGDIGVLPAQMLTPLILLLHELATNSLKYGALSEGSVSGKAMAGGTHFGRRGGIGLTWTGTERDFVLDWSEAGGPYPAAGARGETAGGETGVSETGGSGTTMLRNVVALHGGEMRLDWQAGGLVAQFRFPRG